jgi:hypothetical protein
MSEDLEFFLNREMPKDKISWALENVVDKVLIFGGGALCVPLLGISYEGVEYPILSMAAGFCIGAAVIGYLGRKVLDTAEKARRLWYPPQEEQKDWDASKQGAKRAIFKYQGKEVECVIRREHEQSGKMFEFNTNDETIQRCSFWYKSHDVYPLTFTIGVECIEDNMNANLWEMDILAETEGADINVEVNFEKRGMEKGIRFAVIKYKGDDYNEKLEKFADACSYILEKAAKFHKMLTKKEKVKK